MAHTDSIVELPEGELVRALLANPPGRLDLLNLLGMPADPRVETELLLSGLPGDLEGDLDLLAWQECKPAEALAFQYKRVKVRLETSGRRINKLQEFEKGVRQANLMEGLGFWMVYLCILVVVDGRERNAAGSGRAGLQPEDDDVIRAALSSEGLHPRVGLVRYDFTQVADSAPVYGNQGGIHMLESPTAAPQAPAVTKWVSRLPPPTTRS